MTHSANGNGRGLAVRQPDGSVRTAAGEVVPAWMVEWLLMERRRAVQEVIYITDLLGLKEPRVDLEPSGLRR